MSVFNLVKLRQSGSASNPILLFNAAGGETTGLFAPVAGTIGTTSGGVEKTRVDSTGLKIFGNGTVSGYMQLNDIAAPVNPADGEGVLYKKSSDDGLFWKPDSGGAEIDLTTVGGVSAHGTLTGLLVDDHTQYALLIGRSGGQILIGGTAASDTLTLESTSNATKGTVTVADPLVIQKYSQFTDMTAPSNPSNGEGRLYKKTGDDGIFWLPDSGGAEIDLTESGLSDHGGLTGLLDDDHTQYALLAGRAGGQTLIGGTASGEDLVLTSTSNATKGTVQVSDPLEVDDLDALTATTLLIGKATATKVEIADTTVVTEIQGPTDLLEGVDITGNGTLTGYIEFADMTAPSNPADNFGRIYKKTGDDGVFWKPDSAGAEIDLTSSPLSYYNITSDTIAATNSATYIPIDGMTVTPANSTYLVTFSCRGHLAAKNQAAKIALFSDAAVQTNSVRELGIEMNRSAATMHVTYHTQAVITVSSNTITAQFLSDGSDPIVVYERSLILVRLGS